MSLGSRAGGPYFSPAWLCALLILGACGLAVLFGLLATTNSPILIGLFIGTLIGVALITAPVIMLWLVITGTLVIGGLVVQFLPSLVKVNWLFSVLGFLLFASAVITAMSHRGSRQPLPWWAWLALVMPGYAVMVAVINQVDLFEFLAGFKRYFQYWGLFAALTLITLTSTTYRRILMFLIGLASIQVIIVLFQRIVIVPKRQGMGGGVVPIDAVSGTFEASFLGGGASSVLVFFLLFVFAFVLRMWRDKLIPAMRALGLSLLLLAPLALGETKVVVVFLPLVFVCVLFMDLRTKPIATLGLILTGTLIAVGLALLYIDMNAKSGTTASRVFENILAYNFGYVGYHSADNLNRTTVLTHWLSQQSAADPLGFLFGHGPGSSYIGDGALVPGHLALRHIGVALAFTTLSSLLWDFGIIGLAIFLAFNVGGVIACARHLLGSAQGVRRCLLVAVLTGLLMNLVLMFMYNSATSLPSHSTLYALLLGAAVLLCRPVAVKAPAQAA